MGKFVKRDFETHPIAVSVSKHVDLGEHLSDFIARYGMLALLMLQDGEVADEEMQELKLFAQRELKCPDRTAKMIVNSTLDALEEEFDHRQSVADFCRYMCENHPREIRINYVMLLKKLAQSDDEHDDDEQQFILDTISELIN